MCDIGNKIGLIIILILLHLFPRIYLLADSTSVEVTFISNCGIMLSSGNKSIVIDGLQRPGYYLSSEIEIENQNKLINLEKPFENINAILVTHAHPDHFHIESCIAHLKNNPGGKLIANTDVVTYMQYDSLYEEISDQIIISDPINGEYDSLKLEDLTILTYPMNHFEFYPGFQFPHLAFLVNINGVKIYFGGDNFTEGLQYPYYRIDRKDIDVAFLRYDGLLDNGRIDTLNQFINPKALVPMHYLYGLNLELVDSIENTIYLFRESLPSIFLFGNFLESKTFHFERLTSVENNFNDQYQFNLFQNYPNPFNPSTTIKYSIPASVISNPQKNEKSQNTNNSYNSSISRNSKRRVSLRVYDILGREVAILVNEDQKPGTYEVEFNSHSGSFRNLISGVYFYKLVVGDFIQTKKLVFIK